MLRLELVYFSLKQQEEFQIHCLMVHWDSTSVSNLYLITLISLAKKPAEIIQLLVHRLRTHRLQIDVPNRTIVRYHCRNPRRFDDHFQSPQLLWMIVSSMMSHGHLYMEEKLEVLLEEFDEYLK